MTSGFGRAYLSACKNLQEVVDVTNQFVAEKAATGTTSSRSRGGVAFAAVLGAITVRTILVGDVV